MKDIAFNKEFKSELYKVKDVIEEALAFLYAHITALPENDAYDIKLILSELLINAVVHGNRADERKKVVLCIELKSTNTIVATISDEGSGFNHMELIAEENNVYAENGRGIKLAQSLTDSLYFNVQGNIIKFHKKVGR